MFGTKGGIRGLSREVSDVRVEVKVFAIKDKKDWEEVEEWKYDDLSIEIGHFHGVGVTLRVIV